MSDPLESWFAREILPYEAALMRYLAQRKARPSDLEDLRHDIYVRVLESASTTRPSVPKAFLFITARNLLVDRARRAAIIPFEQLLDFDVPNVLSNDISPERQVSGWQQLQRLAKLFQRLPPKCREVFWRRRIEGQPTKRVAEELGVTCATVEKHLCNAIRQLLRGMNGQTPHQDGTNETLSTEQTDESHHGD